MEHDKAQFKEATMAIRRASADVIISYYTPRLLEWADQDEAQRRKLKAT